VAARAVAREREMVMQSWIVRRLAVSSIARLDDSRGC